MQLHAKNIKGVGLIQTIFQRERRDLWETSDITIEDTGMNHTNMISNGVAGLQEVLHQEQVPTETTTVIEEPVNHVDNMVQNTQQQLTIHL